METQNPNALLEQPNRLAYSVSEFCQAIGGITRQHFYSLKRQGKAPKTFKIGRRTLISSEAAKDWVSQLQAESDSPTSFNR